jgi:hypothetical protein
MRVRRHPTTATPRARPSAAPPRRGRLAIRAGLPELPGARQRAYRDESAPSSVRCRVLVADPTRRPCSRPRQPRPRSRAKRSRTGSLGVPARNAACPLTVCPPARCDRRGRGAGTISRAGPRGARAHATPRRRGGVDHRHARLPPDLGWRGVRRRRRVIAKTRGRGRLPGRQGAGHRVPRRAGHESDPRAGQRCPRPAPCGTSRGGSTREANQGPASYGWPAWPPSGSATRARARGCATRPSRPRTKCRALGRGAAVSATTARPAPRGDGDPRRQARSRRHRDRWVVLVFLALIR